MKESPQEFLNRVATESMDLNAAVDNTGNPVVMKKIPPKRAKKVVVLGDHTKESLNSGNINIGKAKQPRQKKVMEVVKQKFMEGVK